MATARRGSAIRTKINLLLYGAPFSGKSTLAMQAALLKRPDGKNYRVLVFDAENGGTDESIDAVVSQGAHPDDIYVLYTQSVSEIKQYIKKIADNEPIYMLNDDGTESDEILTDSEGKQFVPDVVILDGTSVLKMTTQNSLINLSQKRNKIKAEKANLSVEEKYVAVAGAGMELKDYNKLATTGQDLVLSLMSLPCSVILTSREKDETVSQKDAEGRIASVSTGRKTYDSFKGIDYNCKQIFRMYKDEATNEICAYVEKDRTGVHTFGEVLIDPSLLDYQEMLDKSSSNRAFNVRNDFDKAVATDQKIMEKEVLGPDANYTPGARAPKEIIDEINAIIKALPMPEKQALRAKLKENNLPDSFAKITDVELLNQILDFVKNA
jgi:hypothetical protein